MQLNKIFKKIIAIAVIFSISAFAFGSCAAAVADLNPPQAPFMVFARNAATGGKVIISWRIPSDKELMGFNIYRSSSQGTAGEKLMTVYKDTDSIQDSGLINGTAYYYTISSFDAGNNEAFAPQISATPTSNNAALYPDGALIKFKNRSTIYKVDSDGKTLRPISRKVFDANGYKFGEVAELPIEWINSFKYGNADVFKDGTLLRASGEPTVYIIENGLKRPFVSKSIFIDLGYSLKNVAVIPLSGSGPAENLENYSTGMEINSLGIHSNGTLIRASGDPTVYIISGGQKRPFSSSAIFKSYGYDFKKVITVGAGEFNRYPAGEVMRFVDGSLIQNNSKAVFAASDGGTNLVPFRSAIEFTGLGYKFENVISASEGDIGKYNIIAPLPM